MFRIHATAIVTYTDGSASIVDDTYTVSGPEALRTALMAPGYGRTPTTVEILSAAEID